MTATMNQKREAIERWIEQYARCDFFWTSGPLKGATFSPNGAVENGIGDPHLRGTYERHPQFGFIRSDVHQLVALLDDLSTGRANTGQGRHAPDDVRQDAENLVYILTGEEN